MIGILGKSGEFCNYGGRLLFLIVVLTTHVLHAEELTVVNVHPQQHGQKFEGMGCGVIFYEAHVTSLGVNGRMAEQECLYDDMFSKLRLNYLQLQIRPNHEPKNDNDDPYTPAFDPADFAYCKHLIKIAEAAKKRNPDIKLYAVLYTPPSWMKTNNSESGGGKEHGTLKPGLELELGEYIWTFLAYMQRHGQTIDYLSICNEPDWPHDQPSYYLTSQQHAELFAKVAGYLSEMAKRHPEVPRPKLVAPNMLSAVTTASYSLPATLARAGDQVDIVGTHDYDRRGHRWAKLRNLAGNRPLWQTECCFNGVDKSPGLIHSASEYWLYMTEAFNDGVNVWQAYAYVYPPRQGGEALIHLNWGKSYTLTKIYHGLRQWSAPLTPGMFVVNSSVTGTFASDISKPGVKATSFVSADGLKLVIHVAAVQDQDADLKIRIDKPFQNVPARLWRTSNTEDAVELPGVRVNEGEIVIRLPARGLLTICLECVAHN
jgi:O-glycosyl hydrolase